jgi:hypothetical protein
MRLLLLRTGIVLAVLAGSAKAPAQQIAGTYSLVKDSDGQTPKQQATIQITFKAGGSLAMRAQQPGEDVTDSGTYSVQANLITLHFKEMVWEANHQPFSLDGCTLTLPFMALKSTSAPGSSIWQKQGCASPRADRTGGGSGAGAGGGSAGGSGQSGGASSSSSKGSGGASPAGQAPGKAPAPGPGSGPSSPPSGAPSAPNPGGGPSKATIINPNQSNKPSCSACEYVKCIRETIEQKKKLQAVYQQLENSFGKFYFETTADGQRQPVDTLDGGTTNPEGLQYLLQVHASYSKKEQELTEGIDAPPSCHYDGSQNLELSTNVFTCRLDPVAAADALAAAVPCHQLYDLAMGHEGVHINACLAREGKGSHNANLLLTPYGKAKEEIEAYQMEIDKLNQLLTAAEAKCRFTCRCSGERFATSAECQANCPINLSCPVAAANSCIYPDKPASKK